MLSVENISSVLDALSLEKKPMEGQAFVSSVVSHVQAEPKTLNTLIPKLIDQVRY
jgi:hypothetical protein